jgi:molybdate transport system regulatory protein
LLAAIAETGSISAAARAMGMSYRRAWMLVDTGNRCFARPLVHTVPGGGASLTETGEAILAAYRALAERAATLAESPEYLSIADALDRA